jgi:uncharacterized membrane protein YedE/YeeE
MTITNFTPVASLAGGVLIGLAAVWLLAANGRVAGISTILHGLVVQPKGDRLWRAAFIAGLVCAGFAWNLFTEKTANNVENFGIGLAAVSGMLVGFGTRMGNGCTSGHGVCGLGRRSLRSFVAVCVFMAAGMATVFIVRRFFS